MKDMTRPFRIFAALAATFVALALGACGHVNHLRDAQAAFNEAAAAENAARLRPLDEPMPVATGYAAVVAAISKLEGDADAVRQLQKDRLYANALVLKSMAYWRLGRYDEARDVAARISKELDAESRDTVFVNILPALIGNDQAHAFIYQGPAAPRSKQDRLNRVETLLNDAERTIDGAARGLHADHPMQAYLAASGLATMRNLAAACQHLTDGTVAGIDCRKRNPVQCRAEIYLTRLKKAGANNETLMGFAKGTGADPKVERDKCP